MYFIEPASTSNGQLKLDIFLKENDMREVAFGKTGAPVASPSAFDSVHLDWKLCKGRGDAKIRGFGRAMTLKQSFETMAKTKLSYSYEERRCCLRSLELT